MKPAPQYIYAHSQPIPWLRMLWWSIPALATVPLNMLWMKFNPGKQPWLPMTFHKFANYVVGTTARYHGTPNDGTTLFVSNHFSWADIPILGQKLRARFVAKADIGEGGALAFFCAQQRTLYVDRDDRRGSKEQGNMLVDALQAGDSVILFPEATTNDGRRARPFKSSLFAGLTDGRLPGVKVQPISIAFTRVRSMPIKRSLWPFLCWLGDYSIGESVRDWLRLRHVHAEVVFHEPVDPEDFPDRKALTRYCYETVHRGYRRAMREYVHPKIEADSAAETETPARDDKKALDDRA